MAMGIAWLFYVANKNHSQTKNIYLLIWFIFSQTGCHHVNGDTQLHLTKTTVPEVIDFRNRADISCEYDMNGDVLQSVKWYKDSMEFFR